MKNQNRPHLPPLKSKSKNINWEAINAAKQAREEQQEQDEQIKAWVRGNKNFNIDGYTETWVTKREDYTKKLLDLIIDTMSVADAVSRTNDALQFGLKMPDISIDMTETTNMLDKLFRIRLISVLLNENKDLSTDAIEEVVIRAIATEFPIIDYMPKHGSRNQTQPVPMQSTPKTTKPAYKSKNRIPLAEGVMAATKARRPHDE